MIPPLKDKTLKLKPLASQDFKLILALMCVTSKLGVRCQNPYDVTELFCKLLALHRKKEGGKKSRKGQLCFHPGCYQQKADCSENREG